MTENHKITSGTISGDKVKTINQNIFAGLTFSGEPVNKEEYIQHYEEYVKRCSTNLVNQVSSDTLTIKKGRIELNGVKIAGVEDMRIHVQPNQPSKVRMKILVSSLDASFS